MANLFRGFSTRSQEVSGQVQLFVVGRKGWPALGADNAAASHGICLTVTSYTASVLGVYLERALVLVWCVLGRSQKVSGQALSVCGRFVARPGGDRRLLRITKLRIMVFGWHSPRIFPPF